MKNTLFLLNFLTLLQASCVATDFSPWAPRAYEVTGKLELRSLYSPSIASRNKSYSKSLFGNYLTAGVSALYYNWNSYEGYFYWPEAEIVLANSTDNNTGFDSFIGTLHIPHQDANAGYYNFNLVSSFSFCLASKMGLQDRSSFHHGQFEGIFHLSIGKEFGEEPEQIRRFWGTIGFGIAEKGSPWTHLKLCYDRNINEMSKYAFFAEALLGFGNKNLYQNHSFNGYGPIAHRSIDLGFQYSRQFECGQILTFGAQYRAYAYNFPKNTVCLLLSIDYPFGL